MVIRRGPTVSRRAAGGRMNNEKGCKTSTRTGAAAQGIIDDNDAPCRKCKFVQLPVWGWAGGVASAPRAPSIPALLLAAISCRRDLPPGALARLCCV